MVFYGMSSGFENFIIILQFTAISCIKATIYVPELLASEADIRINSPMSLS